jgi:hypothetical protein
VSIDEASWRADRKEAKLRVAVNTVATVFTIAEGRGGKVAAANLGSRPIGWSTAIGSVPMIGSQPSGGQALGVISAAT